MWSNPQETADLVTFTEEIINGKTSFLCSAFSVFCTFQAFIFISPTQINYSNT